jgi:D-3-phosphoglycerate dehydrogenase / 2-oxoglutarate reductase
MPKVVCTSLNAEEGPHFEVLEQAGFDCRVVDRSQRLFDNGPLIEALEGACAVVAGSEPYPPNVIAALPELRVIARTGVGFDAINLAACDEAGVVVTTTPGVNHHSVAEHTLALLFGVARGFPENDRQVREGRWKRIARPRVMGSTLGLVGLGRIGQAVYTRAVGVGMNVVVHDPFANEDYVREHGVRLVSLDELFATSDYVSLHCPATPETVHLIDDATLARMKPGAVLINTSRGMLVDEAALVRSLEAGHLRGAGLDVFEVEPLPADSPLIGRPDVLLAGHVAGLDRESHEDTYRMAAETIVGLSRGEWPSFCIQNLRGTTDWSWSR